MDDDYVPKSGKKPAEPDDSEDDDPDVWKCRHCTLKNKLPDYRCTVCEKMDNKAFDKYYDRKYKMKASSYNYGNSSYSKYGSSGGKYGTSYTSAYSSPLTSSTSTWTCRYCNAEIKLYTYWDQCKRARNKWDKNNSHCVKCLKNTENNDPLCSLCER